MTMKMKNLLRITEDEKRRILNLHETRKSKEWNLINEQVTGNPGTPVVGATPSGPTVANTPTQTAPTNTAPTNTASTTPTENKNPEVEKIEVNNNDKDYDYKKEGDKYFFKLKTNPVSEKAKSLLTQKKYINWTEAKSGPSLDAIKKLPFTPLAYKGPENVDGSEETFEPPVQTTPTTSNNVSLDPTKKIDVQALINILKNQPNSLSSQAILDTVKSLEK